MAVLETRTLRLRAGARPLIDGLDWLVAKGEFWCVLGRNGAGKSSLLQAIAGLRSIDHGEVRIAEQTLAELQPLALARLRGLMPQQLVDSFSCPVFDAVAIGRTPWQLGSGWNGADDAKRVDEALALVGMAARKNDDLLQLSGGERQRIAFAALLAQDPALMLFDEPTAHQDIAQQQLLMRLMQRLSAEHAVVASCHDINLAARFATHVLLLGEGFHCAGPVHDVMTTDALGAALGCRVLERDGWFFAGD